MGKAVLINCEEGDRELMSRTVELRKVFFLLFLSHLSVLLIFMSMVRSWQPVLILDLTDIIQPDETSRQLVFPTFSFPYPQEGDTSTIKTNNNLLIRFLQRRSLGHLDNIPLYFLQEHLLVLNSPGNICNEYADEDLLILVSSSCSQVDRRQAIRITWGSAASELGVPVVFVLGTDFSGTCFEAMDEIELYNDVVVTNLIDSEVNDTLKSVAAVKWANQNCNNRFVLKVDDDVLVNVQGLLKYIMTNEDNLFGSIVGFPRNSLKGGAFGSGYLIASDVMEDIYIASLTVPYSPREAEFITGIVAEQLNLSRIVEKRFYYPGDDIDVCSYSSMFVKPGVSTGILIRMWEKVHEPTDCRSTNEKNISSNF